MIQELNAFAGYDVAKLGYLLAIFYVASFCMNRIFYFGGTRNVYSRFHWVLPTKCRQIAKIYTEFTPNLKTASANNVNCRLI